MHEPTMSRPLNYQYHALIVDDEADIRELLEITLGRMSVRTTAASTVADAKQLLEDSKQFDLCLTDMRLPDGDGIELVRHIQAHQPLLPVAVITAYGNMRAAVNSLKAGAFDFVSKPVDLKMLRSLVDAALKLSRDKATAPVLDERIRLLGHAPAIEALRQTVGKLARSQAPVHISGESGTGKELVARLIHAQGPRAAMPFVPVNCGAIPNELMESEFFGHLKGSFTGATRDKTGLFQAAQGGTLFLDEVADLPLHMQVKLLRAIQERSVRPVGSEQELAVDVRIISATHKDLAALVHGGQFRQDLYYRLNVIEVRVPALRERPEDIPELCAHILARISTQNGMSRSPEISAEAVAALRSYRFPGNVRELENILERATTLCEQNRIRVEDLQLQSLPASTAPGATATVLDSQIEEIERSAIVKALEKTRYNKTQAARLLGISFRALRYRLKKLGID
jgi:two-component system response regulator PilR (NtrC family)